MQLKKLKNYLKATLIFLLLGWQSELTAQVSQDTVFTKYGDVLVGKIEKVSTDNLNLKVKYRKDAIQISLNQIARVSSNTRFLLNDITNKTWRGALVIDTLQAGLVGIRIEDSVRYFKPRNVYQLVEDKKRTFNDAVKLGLDFGITRIKADNSLSANLGVNAAFKSRRWHIQADYSAYSNNVDTTLNYWRNGIFSGSYVLPKDWFVTSKLNLYSSTEQSLRLRRNIFLGMGKIFIHRSQQQFSVSAGAMSNREEYFTSITVFTGTESFLSTHYSGKIREKWEASIDGSLFPSLSQSGRLRTNLNMDIKYRFLNHFYLGLRYTLNTDNQPQVEASQTDYVFAIKFGWSLQKN